MARDKARRLCRYVVGGMIGALHLNQTEVAARLGTSQGTLSRLMAGKHTPSSVMVKRIIRLAESEPVCGCYLPFLTTLLALATHIEAERWGQLRTRLSAYLASDAPLPDKDKYLIGRSVTALRRSLGMTQADLGRALGKGRQEINGLELGRRFPGPKTLRFLAHLASDHDMYQLEGLFKDELEVLKVMLSRREAGKSHPYVPDSSISHSASG